MDPQFTQPPCRSEQARWRVVEITSCSCSQARAKRRPGLPPHNARMWGHRGQGRRDRGKKEAFGSMTFQSLQIAKIAAFLVFMSHVKRS